MTDRDIIVSLRWFAVQHSDIGAREGKRCKTKLRNAEKEAKFLLTKLLGRKPTADEVKEVVHF